uniref:Uncharacterized protein n=1 Tax=Anguilla anguilla TaxID=7936 RepID=A0A0E9VDI4_ANGAN
MVRMLQSSTAEVFLGLPGPLRLLSPTVFYRPKVLPVQLTFVSYFSAS